MDISVFEVIGPVMIGPSSSSTAGMARLGWVAGKFSEGPIKAINLKFHPRHMDYAGTRSHLGLIGGVLGMREYDTGLRHSLEKAREMGIEVTASRFTGDPLPASGLTVAISIENTNGKKCTVTGVSVGGGSIAIIGVDEFEVSLSSTESHVFIWSGQDIEAELSRILPAGTDIRKDCKNGSFLFYAGIPSDLDQQKLKESALGISPVTKVVFTDPFLTFGYVPHEPLFITYEELIRQSKESGKDMAELAIDYEICRSGRSREEIWNEMAASLEYMRETCERGLTEEVKPLFGFDPGDDGKKMQKATEEGKILSGSTMGRAFARAMATMEMGEAMGRIVAAPTGGSAGIVPGCILTVQEDRGYTDEQLIRSLFVAAAAGVVMYYHKASFSGMGGGCQGEIGVSSAIAASALAYLGGADTETCCHAMALAMKNILGLVCDRIAGSSEIPCTTRNCIGVGNAFAGCDMALSGIRSYVSPDSVIKALVNTQKALPAELRGGAGALRITKEAIEARAIEAKMNADSSLPEIEYDCFCGSCGSCSGCAQ